MIEVVNKHYGSGTMRCNSLTVSLGEEVDIIEDVYAPYLIQKGFLSRTPRGRMVTPAAYRKLERPFPKNQQYEQTEMEF